MKLEQTGYRTESLGRDPIWFVPPRLRSVGCAQEYVPSGCSLIIDLDGVTPFVLPFPRGGVYIGHRLYQINECEYRMDWYANFRGGDKSK